MSQFLRVLNDPDKIKALQEICFKYRIGESSPKLFDVTSNSFDAIPGKPFAYWVSSQVRDLFKSMPPFESDGRTVRQGLATCDDNRFVRTWWEISNIRTKWFPFAKGGAFSPYYADIYLLVNWALDGKEIKSEICIRYPYLKGNANFVAKNTDYYFQPGVTWGDRTTSRLSPRPMPKGVVFSVKGSAGFFPGAELSTIALMNSDAFNCLITLLVGAGDAAAKSYQVGTIGLVPYPGVSLQLAAYSRRSWSLKRALDSISETSHAFILPAVLRNRLGDYDPLAIEGEFSRIQSEVDNIVFDLYGFSDEDRLLACSSAVNAVDAVDAAVDGEEVDLEVQVRPVDGLLSWAVGVSFGRFDWRLATGERHTPHEPEPFDPLPSKSPGMLPDSSDAFHVHDGILVDDQGHSHDLVRLIEEVLERVGIPAPDDVRRWLQKDFFVFHLQGYSKSRRKAPIYWPLSTASGSYTLWVYYPKLNSQTLYTAINDFIEPKLKQIEGDLTALRNKGVARSPDDERQFELLQIFQLELLELRDALLKFAPTYIPNLDDGVQICAAPFWALFRLKSWQKSLKDTWTKLEKGDYDWAYLALNYWPERVREKCENDKSLAVAHGLEDLYIEPNLKVRDANKKKGKGDK